MTAQLTQRKNGCERNVHMEKAKSTRIRSAQSASAMYAWRKRNKHMNADALTC
ncbi:hypothetical protein HMPREF3190_01699 [Umbribacter vaginalis]|nr:hypothetical protein HMPREF3190_01699 [Coriobacteriales bacterium DNF00809]